MRGAIAFLRPYLARRRGRLAAGFGALVAKNLAAAALPVVIRSAVDTLTAGATMEAIARFAGAILLVAAIKGLFQYQMRVILIGVSRDVEFDLRNEIFAHLVRLSRDFYARVPTGDVMARTTNDLNAVRMMVGPALMYWTETMLTFVLAAGVMLSVDVPLTLASLAPAPVVSLLVVVFGRRIHARFEEIQAVFSRISMRVQESVAGMRLLRAYGQGEAEQRAFAALNEDFIGRNLALARTSGLFEPLLTAMSGLAFLIVLWVGGWRMLSGGLSLGSFVMFQTYMGMLIWPMIAMGWVINLMQRGTASLGRIREMLDAVPRIAAPAAPVALGTLRGEIVFDDVTLRYGAGTALSGLSLTIAAGETVAIVGHTGAGKTSLIQLIPRLADPTAGRVLIDGVDLREADPAELRRQIRVVPQETFLFSMTIAENITFGDPDATPAEVAEAVRIAGLEPDLASFAEGLETTIGERGITLSGGQRQRTAIARALLGNPRILILDDALSSVDTLTEERILTGLAEVMRGRTTLLISHRVSTIRYADRIVVLDHGKVAEQGTHAELLARGGYYASLVRKQQLEEELEAI